MGYPLTYKVFVISNYCMQVSWANSFSTNVFHFSLLAMETRACRFLLRVFNHFGRHFGKQCSWMEIGNLLCAIFYM
jgi:hypothetical protein